MSRKGSHTSQASRAAQTLRTIRRTFERDTRHASAIEAGSVADWRRAWGYKTDAAAEYRLQQLQQAGLVWRDGVVWRRELDTDDEP